jgi:hypothetical protein
MGKLLSIIAKETDGRSYSSHRYCFEEYDSPDRGTKDDASFNPKKYGESEGLKTSKGLKKLADSISGSPPLFSYFLDGSRRTYKVDDIAYDKRIYPVVAGQIAVGCCFRKSPDSFSVHNFQHRVLLALPDVADKDGHGKAFFRRLRELVNEKSDIKRLDVELSDILTYRDEKNAKYENLAIAKIHDEMIDLEKRVVVEMTRKNLLNIDAYLIKDGSIEYQKMKSGSFKDLSLIKSSYRRVVGVSKRFDPEFCTDANGKSNAAKIAELPLYHRTPAYMFESKRSSGEEGPVYLSAWYLRIREPKYTVSPFDGILKIEKIIVTDEEFESGLDTGEVDLISANIINERNPVCYGSDARWANHLYPVYLTESFIKSKYLSDSLYLNIF